MYKYTIHQRTHHSTQEYIDRKVLDGHFASPAEDRIPYTRVDALLKATISGCSYSMEKMWDLNWSNADSRSEWRQSRARHDGEMSDEMVRRFERRMTEFKLVPNMRLFFVNTKSTPAKGADTTWPMKKPLGFPSPCSPHTKHQYLPPTAINVWAHKTSFSYIRKKPFEMNDFTFVGCFVSLLFWHQATW